MQEWELKNYFTLEQRARWRTAITRRCSTRVYTGDPSNEQWNALRNLFPEYPFPGVRLYFCSGKPERFLIKLPGVQRITGTRRFVLLLVDDRPDVAPLAGFCGETLMLEAVSMGLGGCWLGAFRRSALQGFCRAHEKVVAVLAFGIPGEKPGEMKRKPLRSLCDSDPVTWPLWAYHGAESVRRAPSGVNLQPWRINFTGHCLDVKTRRPGLELGISALHLLLGVDEREALLRLKDDMASIITEGDE